MQYQELWFKQGGKAIESVQLEKAEYFEVFWEDRLICDQNSSFGLRVLCGIVA